MVKEFHTTKSIFKNKIYVYFLFVFCLGISCNTSNKERAYHLVNKYSDLNFTEVNLRLVNYKEELSGITKGEGIIEAVFKISSLDIDSLKREILNLGYKKLPISELDMGDGFHGNILQSDSGFYRLNLLHKSIIDVLVVVNITQDKVIFYKLIQ